MTNTIEKGAGSRRSAGVAQGSRWDARRAGGNVPRQLGAAELGNAECGLRIGEVGNQENDLTLLQRAVERVNGKPQRPLRLQICKTVVYRDRVKVIWRYLRRFAGGEWYRGGSHVARLNFGPGIAFGKLRNDRRTGFVAYLINEGGGL